MPLDSDVSNADAQLHVEFYECERDPYKGQPFVRIMVPGDKTNVIDQPAKESHKLRFARQWMFFQMKNTEGMVIGTPLLTWHKERPEELTDGQLTELAILKFQSVEQVATASDIQIMRLGMGAAGLRQRARSYLSSKNAQTAGAELAATRAELDELKALVAKLSTVQAAAPVSASAPRRTGWPKGKKRPPKNKALVNVQHNDAATGATGS